MLRKPFEFLSVNRGMHCKSGHIAAIPFQASHDATHTHTHNPRPLKTPSRNNNKGPRQALHWDSEGWILMLDSTLHTLLTDGGHFLTNQKGSVVKECDHSPSTRTERARLTLPAQVQGLTGTKHSLAATALKSYVLDWAQAPTALLSLAGAQIWVYNNISYCDSKTNCTLLGWLPGEMVHCVCIMWQLMCSDLVTVAK